MTRFSKTCLTGLALFAMSLSASPVSADAWRHIQQLALDVQLKSDRLMGETRHYVHTPWHLKMIRCISGMRQRAVRVHVLSIQHGCLDEMSRELQRLDRQFHDVELLFEQAEAGAAHGYGHVHGPTGHVREWLDQIGECIHHIRDDVAALRGNVVTGFPPQPHVAGVPGGYLSDWPAFYGYPSRRSGHHGDVGAGGIRSHGWSRYYPSASRAGFSYQHGRFGIHLGF
jgi:hypothetical protein